jgi:AcrR family transcriptional regulator
MARNVHSAPTTPDWSTLPADAKRERLLAAAERVYAESGLDAPMPAVARAAGAGVGSLYRQFPSKDELVAALAERRMLRISARLDAALAQEEAWPAIREVLDYILGDRAADDISAHAFAIAAADAPVREARRRVRSQLDQLVGRAREQGAVRADATRLDLTLVITSARATRHLGEAAWRRMVELALDGLQR